MFLSTRSNPEDHNPLWKGKDNVFVIVPFGCLPLGAYFRAFKKDWKKASTFKMNRTACLLSGNKKIISFNEERLVVTLKSYIKYSLYKYIVETIKD